MADVTFTVTGLSSTSTLGDLSYTGVSEGYGRYTWGQAGWNDSDLLEQGWGRDAYGSGMWGDSPYVLLPALSATSTVGALDPADQVMGLTGLTATSSVGTLDPADQVMGLTGQSATSSVGALSPADVVGLSGLSATSSLNLPTENVYIKPGWGTLDWGENGWGTVESAVFPLTGLSATASVGTLDPADQSIGLTGLSATSALGSLSGSDDIRNTRSS